MPQAVAYAALAGAPPEAGLATALAAGVLYAIFGTCRELDVGPSSTVAITAAAVMIPVAASYPGQTYASLLAALAMLTGVVLVVAGALRLGFVAEFLARPVLVGFISGIGVLIIVSRFRSSSASRSRAERAGDGLARGRRVRRHQLGDDPRRLGLARCVARASPDCAARPWALVVTVVAIACSRAFDFPAHGIAVIADVPAGLPSLALPGIGLGEIGALSGGALALALVALAESIGAARSLAAKGNYEIDPNQELIALGAANVGAGLLQGFPADASLSRSAVGEAAGVPPASRGSSLQRSSSRRCCS